MKRFIIKNMKYIFFLFLLVFTCLSQAQAQVDPKDLSRAVKERLLRVPEFSFIKEEADKLGVKVYLFGGTASAFGHYVRWDLERERGDKKYQKERFDYDFTNIYRGNQDLDIVVDGTVEQALDLKQILKEKYPHFVGDKKAWEIRLLRDQIEKKSALLNDPDFLNQHTDTNSTGMIAINDQGDDDDFVFRDLFSWDEEESAFLKDVSSARITFLYSKTHNETTRYKEGKNPPIFAAVRYLAKLAQYELKGIKEDLDLIKKIIKETDWSSVQNNSYVKYKLEEFGKKVLLNAPNLEYAWNLLEDTGLRKKLIEMDGNRIRDEGTLSWWMNKEPLRSKPIGLGRGRRAEEIFLNQMDESADNKNADKNGEIILSHETSDFKAYENITRSSRGEANVFISRRESVGESALLGDGFYTKLGFEGAKGTNLTIRFKLNLKAREESDFIYNRKGVVILKNKKAITLMQENINMTLKDFIKLILNEGIGEQDLGLIEKMKRKFKRKVFENNEIDEVVLYLMKPNVLKSIFKKSWILYLLPTMEKSKHFDLFLKKLVKNKKFHDELLKYFFSQEVSVQYEEQLDFIINNLESKTHLIEDVLSKEHWKSKHYLIDEIIKKGIENEIYVIAKYVLSKEHWKSKHYLIDEIIKKGIESEIYAIVKYVLSKKHWEFKHYLIDEIIKKGIEHGISAIIEFILPNKVNRKWFLQISELKDMYYDYWLVKYVLSQPIWKNNGDLITKILSNHHKNSIFNNIQRDLIDKIVELLMLPHWREHPNWYSWAEKLIENKEFSNRLPEFFLSQKESVQYEEQLNFIINNLESKELLIKYFFSRKHWKSKRSLIDVDEIIQEGKTDEIFAIIKYVLPNEVNRNWFLQISELEDGHYNSSLITYVLSQPIWKNNGDLITKFLSNHHKNSIFNNSQRDLINEIIEVLMLPHWREHPNWYFWAEKFIENKEFFNMLSETFLFEEESVQYEEQLNFIINNLESKALLIKYFVSREHWKSKRSLIDVDEIIQEGKRDEIFAIVKYILSYELNRNWFLQISELKDGYYDYWLVVYVLYQPIWRNNGDLITKILSNAHEHSNFYSRQDLIDGVVELLMLPHWRKDSNWYFWAEKLIKNKEFSNRLPEVFLSQEESVQYEEQLNFIINNLESKELLIKYFFSRKHWKSKRSLIDLDKIVQEGKRDEIFAIIKYVLPNEVNRNWFLQISELSSKYNDYNYWLVKYVLSQPIWKNNGDLITKLLENHYRKASIFNIRTSNDLTSINRIEIIELLMLPHWREHPEWHSWVEKILFPKNSPSGENQLQAHFIKMHLDLPHWNRQINIINRLLDNPSNIREMAFYVFNLPHMLDHPYLIKKAILKSKHKDDWVSLSKVFKNKGWEKFPEILVMLIQKGIDANNIKNNIAKILRLNYFIGYPKNTVDIIFESNIVRVLKLDHWKNHPDLIAFTGKENFTIQDIYLKSKEQDFLDFQNNRNNKNNKKISSKEDGVLYSDNEKLHSSNEEETLYSGEKPYSASGGERTCTVLLN